MQRIIWLGLLSAALLLVAALILLQGLPKSPSGPEAVKAAPAAQEHWVQGIAYVEPVSEVRRLIFKSSGVIDQCLVEVGQSAKKGQILMVLGNEEQQKQVAAAEKDLALAKAEEDKIASGINKFQIAAAESKMEMAVEEAKHASKEFERSRTMFTSRSASQEDFDRARTNMVQKQAAVNSAEAELLYLRNYVRVEDRRVAEAKVSVAAARLELAKQQLRDTQLFAPLAGTVLEILKREGDGVRLTETEPVLIFADLSKLRVRAEVDERYARFVREGQEAVVFGRGLGTESYTGVVSLVKRVMGKKTVFSKAATERKDLDVVQVFIETSVSLAAPVGLETDVKIRVGPSPASVSQGARAHP